MIGILELVLLICGAIVGFLNGLLGVGGAVLLIPMLIYIPPVFGLTLSMHEVMGLSMALVFFVTLVSAVTHLEGGKLKLHKNLIIILGSTMLLSSLLGAVISNFMTENFLLSIFAVALAISIILMFKPKGETDINGPDDKPYMTLPKEKVKGVVLVLFIGLISGMVGIGGAVMLIPALAFFFKIPIKVCIGVSLGIILLGSAAGFVGKVATEQVLFIPAVFLTIGGIIAAWAGSKLSLMLKGDFLRKLLTIVLVLVLIQILFTLFM